ncbi:organic cation transporter protein-like [Schistocerca gregaria]|uniref:organic cation transporter protein-like n=1 Tax=Schistocerca gregaria TaxID=7010 RepID=UPI00211F0FF1|nr:organic cation transporter protein-like [Schistocerca gregaria]XP_049845122.1 organic cation transporter protein-like [Schistocerca gregaria]
MSSLEIDLDDVLEELGHFGKYQILSFVLMGFPTLFLAATSTSFVFTAAELNYRCYVPDCDGSPVGADFSPHWLQNAVPVDTRGDLLKPAHCRRYIRNSSVVADIFNSTCPALLFTNTTERCDEWVYEGFETSIQSEWDITCDEELWKLGMVGTVNNFGYLLGLPVFGYISDRFGRKKVFMYGMGLTSILGFARAYANNYMTYLVLEFLAMFVMGGNFSSIFILGMELMGPKRRAVAGIVINAFDSLGPAILGLAAWWLKDWKKLILALYVPSLLFIAYYWLLQESVRWLMAQGRMKEAGDIVKAAAKTNGVILSEGALKKFDVAQKPQRKECSHMLVAEGEGDGQIHVCCEERELPSTPSLQTAVLQVFRSHVLLPRLLNCCYCWITNTFVYTGLSLNSVSLAGNKYENFVLSSLVEQPACILTYFMMDSIGRKATLCSTLVFSGTACFACLLVPNDLTWVTTMLFMMAKFAITVSFCALYSFTAEIFPTQLRNSLLGTCSMIGRLGSLAATQTSTLARYMESLPLILYGSMTVASGLLALLFPETKNTKMPDTVEDAENFGRKPSRKFSSLVTSETCNVKGSADAAA